VKEAEGAEDAGEGEEEGEEKVVEEVKKRVKWKGKGRRKENGRYTRDLPSWSLRLRALCFLRRPGVLEMRCFCLQNDC
jgi:hypothetical protein